MTDRPIRALNDRQGLEHPLIKGNPLWAVIGDVDAARHAVVAPIAGSGLHVVAVDPDRRRTEKAFGYSLVRTGDLTFHELVACPLHEVP